MIGTLGRLSLPSMSGVDVETIGARFERPEARGLVGPRATTSSLFCREAAAPEPARLDAAFLSMVRGFGLSLESSDSYTYGHCERVAGYAATCAQALGLDETEISAVRLGAYLHDIGKIRVPRQILNKPGRLRADEFAVMQMHPLWGLELVDGIELPWDVRPTIRWHHEKCDGSGYPDRLRGDEIPLHASIIGIADVYDALTTNRSYRRALSSDETKATMGARRRWWRPEVYAAFRRAVDVRHATVEAGAAVA
jgi:putative nucleotidyltransferase with HDIG domain